MSPDDGRLGLLHASVTDRVSACPGSWQLEKQLPAGQLARPSSYAASGTRIAQWLAKEEVQLSPEELTTAMMCREDEDAALVEWRANTELLVSREKRYYLRVGLVPLMSAKPDFADIEPTRIKPGGFNPRKCLLHACQLRPCVFAA